MKHFVQAVNQLMRTDEVKDEFLGHARDVQRLYKAVMPDPIIPKLAPKAQVVRKLDNMIRLNASRYDYLDRFQKMIEACNSGAMSIEALFEELVKFSKDLNEEEQRHLRENVSEEELAVFDILTRPGPDLDPKEVETIKKVCKELLAKLKTELLVLAWRNKRTTRAAVRVEIEKMLDAGLPEKYTTDLFETKCGVLFQHVLEKYPDEGWSVYRDVG